MRIIMAIIRKMKNWINVINTTIRPATSFYTFNSNDYSALNPDGSTLNTSIYQVTKTVTDNTDQQTITYTVKNVSANSVKPPRFRFTNFNWLNNGGTAVGGANPLTRIFYPDATGIVMAMSTSESGPANFQNQWYRQRGSNYGINAPCVAASSSNRTIGISATNFDMCQILNFGGYYFDFEYGVALGSDMYPTYLKPNETKTYTFFIRATKGTGDAACIEVWKPMLDWLKANKPFVHHTTKFEGLILGDNVAGTTRYGLPVTTPRKYFTFNGIRADTATGFKQFLYAVLDTYGGATYLKSLGYRGLMLWAMSGWTSTNYSPGTYQNLPANLKNTVHEIAEFEAETGIKLFLYYGYAGRYYQANDGNYDSPVIDTLVTRYTTSNYPPLLNPADNNWDTYSFRPGFIDSITYNILPGLQYSSGIDMDFGPNSEFETPAEEQLYLVLRNAYPNKLIFVETSPTLLTMRNTCPHFFNINLNKRNALLDYLVPEYQAIYQLAQSPTSEAGKVEFNTVLGLKYIPLTVGQLIDLPNPWRT